MTNINEILPEALMGSPRFTAEERIKSGGK
jgi:hypothetical protein